jgi:parallel beta-helix repeat protein
VRMRETFLRLRVPGLLSAALLMGVATITAFPPAISAAAAPVLYVNAATGSDTTGTGSAANPFASIQAAVKAASPGSTVLVEPGTYTGMVTITVPLTLENDPANPGAVVLDATGQQNGIQIQSGASGTTVRGFTIENAQQAGLLAIGPLTQLTIEDNTVENNAQGITPALEAKFIDYEALHLEGVSDSLVADNLVENNLDGGIYLTDEPGPSEHNVIADNVVDNNKVDCAITLASHAPNHGIIDNTVADNTAIGNGAAGVILATAVPGGIVEGNVISNNTLADNMDGGVSLHTHAPGSIVADNVVVDNIIGVNHSFQIAGTPSVGISMLAAGSPITDTLIQGNSITGNLYGIYETPWLTSTTVVGPNTFSRDVINHKVGVSFQAFAAEYAKMPPGFLGPTWIPAQRLAAALVKLGITTDVQYAALLRVALETPAGMQTTAQKDAIVLFRQFGIIY